MIYDTKSCKQIIKEGCIGLESGAIAPAPSVRNYELVYAMSVYIYMAQEHIMLLFIVGIRYASWFT